VRARRAWLLLVGAALAAACSGAQTARPPRGPLTARDYLPLRAGAAWSYDTATGYGTGTVLSAMSVVRADGARFLVRTDGRTATYEVRPDGVLREGEYYVRDPLRVGATWEGRDGARFEVRAVEQSRTVGGQRFDRVIEVLRTGSSSQIRTTTWYAADVGAVEVEAHTTSSLGQTIAVRSTLRGFTLGE
jgi:hypothetical protein